MIKFEDIPFYTAIAISVIFTIIREFFPTYKYLPNIDIPLLNTFLLGSFILKYLIGTNRKEKEYKKWFETIEAEVLTKTNNIKPLEFRTIDVFISYPKTLLDFDQFQNLIVLIFKIKQELQKKYNFNHIHTGISEKEYTTIIKKHEMISGSPLKIYRESDLGTKRLQTLYFNLSR